MNAINNNDVTTVEKVFKENGIDINAIILVSIIITINIITLHVIIVYY